MTALTAQNGRGLRSYTDSQLDLIRRTVAKDTTDQEFSLFVEVCKQKGLDPFKRQIYCVVYNKDNKDKRQAVWITGIDGLRAVAARNGDYRPDDHEPELHFDDAAKDPNVNPLGLVRAVVRCYKKDPDKDEWFPVVGVAYWDEYAPLKEVWEYDEKAGKRQPTGRYELDKSNKFWSRSPRVMLPKVAEALALRKGWPEDLSGLYAQEELTQANVIEGQAHEIVEQHRIETREKLANVGKSIMFIWDYGADPEMVEIGKIADRCMAYIESHEPGEVDAFIARNRHALREFWTREPNDALAVKKAAETKLKKVEASQS